MIEPGDPHEDLSSTQLTAHPDRGLTSDGNSESFEIRVLEGVDKGRLLVLDGSLPARVLVGTSPSCEFRLTDHEISRRHASLEIIGGRCRIVDLDSTNGTIVDRVPVVGAYLQGTEFVRMGSTLLRVDRGARRPATHLPRTGCFGRLIGASQAMRRLYPLCERLAASTFPVIIEGETGTGKEVLAESLHEQGPRAHRPFVVFDCTATPPTLIESELFGHERGAFTGAIANRKGVFELADGGTLLIDEIGDLEPALQPKFLRALERSEIRRVGGNRPIGIDVRVLCATRRDLDRQVQAGRFRDDLFHRLAVARIELPPLRKRQGDIPLLALHFAQLLGAGSVEISAEVLRHWEDHPWPGNVRELRNHVARQIALGTLIDAENGPGQESSVPSNTDMIDQVLALDLPLVTARQRVIDAFERRYVERVLATYGGNVTRAAQASGVARRHFQRLRARSRVE